MLLHALLNLLVSGRIVSPIAITNMLGPDRATTGHVPLQRARARHREREDRCWEHSSFILHPSRRVAATIARFERAVSSNSPRGAE